VIHTSKSLLDVDHLTGTCLHKATAFALGPFPTNLAAYDPGILEITLIAGNYLDGRELPTILSSTTNLGSFFSDESSILFDSILGLNIDHVKEPREPF